MRGADVVEQMASYISTRVRRRKGWFYIFRRLLFYALNNAFIVYKMKRAPNTVDYKSLRCFVEALILELSNINANPELLETADSFEKKIVKKKRLEDWIANPDKDRIRLRGTHAQIKKDRKNCPECSMCRYNLASERRNAKITTPLKRVPGPRIFCSCCDVPLCVPGCFDEWHRLKHLPYN